MQTAGPDTAVPRHKHSLCSGLLGHKPVSKYALAHRPCRAPHSRSRTGQVSYRRPTALSPNTPIIGVYILALYVMQVGHCVLLVLATKQETKQALTKAVGYSLVFSNFVMAIWAIAWVRIVHFFLVWG